jgi:hypothetical protein
VAGAERTEKKKQASSRTSKQAVCMWSLAGSTAMDARRVACGPCPLKHQLRKRSRRRTREMSYTHPCEPTPRAAPAAGTKERTRGGTWDRRQLTSTVPGPSSVIPLDPSAELSCPRVSRGRNRARPVSRRCHSKRQKQKRDCENSLHSILLMVGYSPETV